jgi:hypothetical protein
MCRTPKDEFRVIFYFLQRTGTKRRVFHFAFKYVLDNWRKSYLFGYFFCVETEQEPLRNLICVDISSDS